jgi:hypothetical protein
VIFAGPVYPDAESLAGDQYTAEEINKLINDQRRLCAYRSLVFWAYPNLRRQERRPLPSCLYLLVRATFPGMDEEIWSDYNHSIYTERIGDDD